VSKLEKALNKARADRKNQLIVVNNNFSENPESSSVLPEQPARISTITDLELRETKTREIALMDDPHILSEGELALRKIIHSDMENGKIANSFRELRTKILHKSKGENKTIMVTSPTSKGGSSFVSVNLAAAFSFDESKTSLLIDCNIKSPGLSKLLPNGSNHGLTDYLESVELDVAEIIHSTGIKRLRIIPAGEKRETTTEYFTSAKTRKMLDGMSERYPDRYIVLDSPPILESADTHILAELCDYILLVVPYGKHSQSQIKEAIQSLDGSKLIGVVFNNEPVLPRIDWRSLVPQLSDFYFLKDIFKKKADKPVTK